MGKPTDKHRAEAREMIQSQVTQWHTAAEGAEPSHLDIHRIINTGLLTERIAASLSSRDVEVCEVLEGLRYRHGCWCELPPNITSPDHTCECDAARGLWERVRGE